MSMNKMIFVLQSSNFGKRKKLETFILKLSWLIKLKLIHTHPNRAYVIYPNHMRKLRKLRKLRKSSGGEPLTQIISTNYFFATRSIKYT